MKQLFKLVPFLKPYLGSSVLALVMLTALVFFDLAIPRLIQRIIDQGIEAKNMRVVLDTALVMIGISFLSAVFTIGNNYFSVLAGEGLAFRLREALFAKIQTFSFANLDEQKTGRLMVRMTSDANAVQHVVMVTLRIGTRAPLLMIGSLALMIATSPPLALVMLPLLMVTALIIALFTMKMEPLFREVQQRLDGINTIMQENIAGVRLVKSFVRRDYEETRFEKANEEYAYHSIKALRLVSNMVPLLRLCINIGIVVVVWAGGIRSVQGGMTIGEIVAFTNYLLTTMLPLIMMTVLANIWAGGIASAKRINEVLHTDPDIADTPDATALSEAPDGKLVLDDVSFRYNSGNAEDVIAGVSLTIEPGRTVAILGATGAGKTTLIQLLPRFYDVSSGRILLDGIDIRRLKQASLLRIFGIVPQETVLFSGTIRDNITYGNHEAGDEEMIEAAKTAQAHEFILELPQGYDTHVKERGVNLSGGQKQRIAIARALLTHPRILILDDSTSSVDVETEAKIHRALAGQKNRRTTIIVAQRISTVLGADRIVLLEKGRVIAEGSHQELMGASDIYREIFISQLGEGLGDGNKRAEAGGESRKELS
jgi:ATP-binding cassette subfamily B protein